MVATARDRVPRFKTGGSRVSWSRGGEALTESADLAGANVPFNNGDTALEVVGCWTTDGLPNCLGAADDGG